MSNLFTRTKLIKIDDVEIAIGSLTVVEVRELILKDMDAGGENGYFTGPVYDKTFAVVATSLNHADAKLSSASAAIINPVPRFKAETLTAELDPHIINTLFTEILAFHDLKVGTPGESSAADKK